MAAERLPLGARVRERADFVLPLPGQAVLAGGSGGVLSAPGQWPLGMVVLAGG